MNTIDTLFHWFLAATVRASLLALAVLALQSALRARMAARWRYVLWLPVIFVLVAPQLPQSDWSAENYVAVHVKPVAPAETPVKMVIAPGEAEKPAASTLVQPSAPMGWRQAAALVWLAGSGLMIFAGLGAYLRTMRRVRRGSIPVNAAVRESLAEAAAACGLRRVPRILVSTEVTSPAVTGLLKPVLLLPAGMQGEFSREEWRLILTHECMHLRRFDVAGNWLLCLLQAVHWCNPVLWLAFARLRADRETACDEQVLARRNGEERAGYGQVLLKLAGAPRQPGFAVGLVGIFGPGAAMRSRILAIARYRRRHSGWGILSLVLVAALIVAGATRAPQAQAAEDKAPQIMIDARIISFAVNPEVPIDIEGEKLGAKGNAAIAVQRPDSFQKLMAQFTPEKGGTLLSAPRVLTRDGLQAVIEVGEEAPKQEGVARRFVGYTLEVTPKIERAGLVLDFTLTVNKAVDAKTGEPLAGPIKDWSRVKIETQQATAKETLQANQSLSIYEPGNSSKKEPALVIGLTPTVMPANANFPAPPAAIRGEIRDVAPPAAAGEKRPLVAKAAGLIIPKFELRDATIAEAMQKLFDLSKEADPDKKGVPMTLDPSLKSDARITLTLSKIPVIEVLKYITNLAELGYRFEGERVVIGALGEVGGKYAKKIQGKPGFVSDPDDPEGRQFDVRGMPPKTKIQSPFSGSILLVPSP